MSVIQIYFDGGTIGKRTHTDGGDGYGSWEACWNGVSKKASRVHFAANIFGGKVTNNVAEYLALTRGLEWLQSIADKHDYHVHIYGDSELVLKTLSGKFKLKAAHLRPLRDRCLELLAGFGSWQTEWQGRANNVRRFGH